MRVAVSGSHGLVGEALVAALERTGHEVSRLVRADPDPSRRRLLWDPEAAAVDAPALEGMDAVVHLAGANVAARRWTQERKQAIAQSRIEGSRVLVEALASLRTPPSVLIQASAMGFYGDRGDEILDERSAGGVGFLAEMARDWEAQTLAASEAGIRVLLPRISLVLASGGGAFPRLLKPFRMGVGGRLGSGRQWMSWIHLEDLVEILLQALIREDWAGPLNACTSQPVRNADFTHTLGRLLHRPTAFPAPAFALRLLLGEMAPSLLLASQRLQPALLEASRFSFRYPDLGSALRQLLG